MAAHDEQRAAQYLTRNAARGLRVRPRTTMLALGLLLVWVAIVVAFILWLTAPR